jgi:hypothetical protein
MALMDESLADLINRNEALESKLGDGTASHDDFRAHAATLTEIERREPPLRLTIAAVACAGSGVICGVPVQQMREDAAAVPSRHRASAEPTLAVGTQVSCARFRGCTVALLHADGIGDNEVHASASPFEALAERLNWMGVKLEEDSFGKALLDSGIPKDTILAWTKEPRSSRRHSTLMSPQVPFDGKKASFDINVPGVGIHSRVARSAIQAMTAEEGEEFSVTELDLSDRGLHVAAAMLVASLLPATSVLKNCNLLKNSFHSESAKMLAKIGAEKGIMLSGMKRDHTEVSLSGHDLKPADGILIGADLKFMAFLTYLDMSTNDISDDGAKSIAEALKVNAVLTTLNLWSNSIGDEGAMAIAEALKVNVVLTKLHLGHNNIGDDGAKAIAEALKVNVVLTKLVFWKCSLGDAGKQAVQDAVKGRSGFKLYL